jgi:hypothetical protein
MIDGTEVASIGYRKVHNTEVFVRVLPHGDFGRMCADPRLEG